MLRSNESPGNAMAKSHSHWRHGPLRQPPRRGSWLGHAGGSELHLAWAYKRDRKIVSFLGLNVNQQVVIFWNRAGRIVAPEEPRTK